MIALCSAGFNHVDIGTARDLRLTVSRVPAYSPHAVAEHTIALMLSLNRKIYRAYARVRDGNFALDGLLGFDLFGRTVGIVGFSLQQRDPVCGMSVTPDEPAPEAIFNGTTYRFCSDSCREQFVRSPAHYVTRRATA